MEKWGQWKNGGKMEREKWGQAQFFLKICGLVCTTNLICLIVPVLILPVCPLGTYKDMGVARQSLGFFIKRS